MYKNTFWFKKKGLHWALNILNNSFRLFFTSGDAKPKYSQSHVPPAKLPKRKSVLKKIEKE